MAEIKNHQTAAFGTVATPTEVVQETNPASFPSYREKDTSKISLPLLPLNNNNFCCRCVVVDNVTSRFCTTV
jgi:hypothetical protein